MANMFKTTKAKNIKEYISSLSEKDGKEICALHVFMKKSVPKLKAHFAYNMLGYGSFPYKNYKGEKIKWPIVALARQKNYISIYVCAMVRGKYLAEEYRDKLGKVSVGKSCIRFKKIEDINLPELKKLLEKAEKNPGLIN